MQSLQIKDKKMLKITVANTGDRPIQVGSHTHFAEANKALEFDREKSLGFHLNILQVHQLDLNLASQSMFN